MRIEIIEFGDEMVVGGRTIKRILGKFEPKRFVRYSGHTFLNKLPKEPVVVDLGGNYGDFAHEFLSKNRCKRYICVEPDPEMYEKIRKRVSNYRFVELENIAVGTDAKGISFFVAESTGANSMFKEFAEKQGVKREIKVDSYSFDSLFEKYNIGEVDWMKIDVEGAEWEFIKNASDKNLLKVSQISIEFHNFLDFWNKDYFDKTNKIIERLYLLGFRPFFMDHDYSDMLFVNKHKVEGV